MFEEDLEREKQLYRAGLSLWTYDKAEDESYFWTGRTELVRI